MADITMVFAASARLPKEEFRRITGPPLGILYLTAALRAAGYQVEVRDYQFNRYANPLDIESFVEFATAAAPILGIGCFSQMLPLVLAGTRRLKERNPSQRIVLGGPGPSSVAEQIIGQFPQIDAVCCGESESTLVELAEAWLHQRSPEDVAGIVWREGNRPRVNAPRARIQDLDALPRPAYDAVDLGAYDFAYVMTARGCPYRCSFCEVSSLWQHRTTWRSVDNVVEELRVLAETHGRREILISDDTFVLRRQRVLEFCRRLKEEKLCLRWWCYGRINHMDEELMAAMADAGCRLVFYGVESGSDRVLRRIEKGFTIEQAEAIVAQSLNHFAVDVSYIWGYPFESLDDFRLTLESILRMLQLDPRVAVYFSLLSPLPLSPLRQEYASRIVFSDDLVGYGEFAFEPFRTLGGRVLDPEILSLITGHPDIFSAHYHFDCDDLEAKKQLLKRYLGACHRLIGRAHLSPEFQRKLISSPAALLEEELDPNALADRLAVYWLASVFQYRQIYGDRGPLGLEASSGRRSGPLRVAE